MNIGFDPNTIETPAYVIDMGLLERNLRILDTVQQRTNAKILLALKGFATYSTFPLVRKYLHGTCASGIHEARLGHETFGGETHVYSPAYTDPEIAQLLHHADHFSFNSFSQWRRYRPVIQAANRDLKCGIRINPRHSEVKVAIYDPCASRSRLGVTLEQFRPDELDGITGLHFHTLCELNANALERTLNVVTEKFGPYIQQMEWMNFGGGHHITREDYDVDHLCDILNNFRKQFPNIRDLYLEPGEAIALNTGYLIATVLDIIESDGPIAILDTSATAHMPDILEMPYRPQIIGGANPNEKTYCYRLGGTTCLAGDVIGDYSFDTPLEIGSKLVFQDMAHYTMVKNTTFNGAPLPSIALFHPSTKTIEVVRRFSYEDYRTRLS
ncbi:MAG: carboxynorspermidine decarboxylase [FCB group bacterium]|jgi:carboxynorspermidine decarboxylase|nr:carboxynorspermidine decarboxylase [FCB group bacterium]